MVPILSSIVVFLLLLNSDATAAASSNTLFEGLYKVTLHGQHVGYAIQRYEYDGKKKQFISTMYSKTSPAAGDSTESLKAYSNQSLTPIKYQYTSQSGKNYLTIDTEFKLATAKITTTKNGKQQVLEKPLPKNVFLSTFLFYRIMNNPKGLSLGTKYDFDAWAEEDATVYSGESWVQKTSQWQGRETSQILNQFKNSRYITWLNLKGEIMGTHSPAEGVRTELVATLAEAAGPVPIKNKSLITLFGYIPQGLNDLNRSTNTPATPTPKQGLPPKGQRIFIKSQPLGKTPPTGIPSQNEEHGGANSAVQSNDNKDAQ